MIRILIAEDSLTTRALLREILCSDPEIQVIGQAKTGVEAVAMTRTLKPDLVTMDIHMPDMDGLTATKEIMIAAPTPTIIITGSSAPTKSRCPCTHCARALDVLSKPPGPAPGFEEAAGKLIATVKAMSQVKVVRHWRGDPHSAGPARPTPYPRGRRNHAAVLSLPLLLPPVGRLLCNACSRTFPAISTPPSSWCSTSPRALSMVSSTG